MSEKKLTPEEIEAARVEAEKLDQERIAKEKLGAEKAKTQKLSKEKIAEIKAIAKAHKVEELFENSKGEYFTQKHLAILSENGKKENVKTHTVD